MCWEVNVPELKLMLFVRTQWALMFACLDRALTLQTVCTYTAWQDLLLIHRQAVTRFTQLMDDSEDVPPLQKKMYDEFHLSRPEWRQLKLLHELLKVSHHYHFRVFYMC
jgi:hypothetical protein